MCINQRNALKSGIACEACQDFLDDVSASSDLGGKLGAKDGDSTVSKHVLTTCQNSKLGQVTCLYSWQSVKAASVRSLVPMHVGLNISCLPSMETSETICLFQRGLFQKTLPAGDDDLALAGMPFRAWQPAT